MKRRFVYGFVGLILGLNLFVGAQIYLYSAKASDKNDPYTNYRLLSEVLEKVRQEYVDGDKVTYEELIHGALKGMLGTLDPHSEFMDVKKYKELKDDTQGEFGGVGIVISMSKDKYLTVVAPMEDTPGFKAGILSGDRITKIDGKSTEKMTLEDAVKRLRGEPDTAVTLEVYRPSSPTKEGQIKDFKLTRAIIKVDTVKDVNGKREFPISDNHIGYVRLTQFGEQTSSDLEKALKKLESQGMQALVLDLRGNPGGLLDQAGQVCEKFVPRGQLIVSTEGRGSMQRSEYRAHGDHRHPQFPIAVLINGGSASASEIVAGCLQDLQNLTHAIVIGEQSFGKGSVQSILPLPDGSALRLTTAKYYTPSHKVIHEHGITPDILVPMSDEDERDISFKRSPGGLETLDEKERDRIKSIHDVQLERASDVLKGVLLYSQRNGVKPEKVASKN
ncbi:MAG: Carboxy-terminal-processing protease [Verrucomicrobiales bacterium]|nr:Carboxy-terminal-processing protease [Verrucomicrobiales bacterium]